MSPSHQAKVADGFRADQIPKRLDLHAWVARLRGEEVRYDWATGAASGFKRFERESNALLWYPYKSLDGMYDVELTYACDDAIAGSPFRVSSLERGAPAQGLIEGVIEGTGGKFVTKKLNGSLPVRPGTETITFALTGDDKSAAVKVQKITLLRR